MAFEVKRLVKSPRMWILMFFLVISIIAIPSYKPEGVEVSFVQEDSPFEGMIAEEMVVTELNGKAIADLNDYTNSIELANPGDMVSIVAGGTTYRAVVPGSPEDNLTPYIGLNVKKTSNIRLELGLDLQGGARVILLPIPASGTEITSEVIDTTRQVLSTRLNAFGLRNALLREVTDLEGNTYLEVEMAGEGSEQIVDLVKSIGKFEIKILNKTIFTGDSIVPPIGEPSIDQRTGAWGVPFNINNKAAKDLRESYVAVAPSEPQVCNDDLDCEQGFGCSGTFTGGQCLPNIQMFLDEKEGFAAPPAVTLHENWLAEVDSNSLVVQTGNDPEQANKVKVILEAGRLPGQIQELRVISQDYVDPKLGKDFIRGAVFAFIGALLAVAAVVFIRYRRLKIALPILFTGLSEIVIILGMAALIKWSIDLPAIAGVIATLGTGIDQQIIITDEIFKGDMEKVYSLKRRVKKAYRIIVIAVSTTIAAMIPLLLPQFTGLYVLRGFAIVTILGALIGILITRPAYAKMAEILFKPEE